MGRELSLGERERFAIDFGGVFISKILNIDNGSGWIIHDIRVDNAESKALTFPLAGSQFERRTKTLPHPDPSRGTFTIPVLNPIEIPDGTCLSMEVERVQATPACFDGRLYSDLLPEHQLRCVSESPVLPGQRAVIVTTTGRERVFEPFLFHILCEANAWEVHDLRIDEKSMFAHVSGMPGYAFNPREFIVDDFWTYPPGKTFTLDVTYNLQRG